MKTNAVIRIVLYSIVILLLTGILLSMLGVGQLRFDLGGFSGRTLVFCIIQNQNFELTFTTYNGKYIQTKRRRENTS